MWSRFREQLLLKLSKGKLDLIIQKGIDFVGRPRYREAELFWGTMRTEITGEAQKRGWDADAVVGLRDTAVDVELLPEPAAAALVWASQGKTYSIKLFNAKFSLKKC